MAEVFAPTLNMLKESHHLNLLTRTIATEELLKQLPLPGTRPLQVRIDLSVETYPPRLEIKEEGRIFNGQVERQSYRYDWGAPIGQRYGFASPEHPGDQDHYHQLSVRAALTNLDIAFPHSHPQLLRQFYEWMGNCNVKT